MACRQQSSVIPAFIGGRSFWWDALVSPGRTALPDQLRQTALLDYGGEDHRVRAWAMAHGYPLNEVPSYACAASESDLAAAASTPGITLGSHTWSHPNLAQLSSSALKSELERPLAWLRERFTNISTWLSYPYGEASAEVGAVARSAGYRGGLLVTGGWLPVQTTDHFMLPVSTFRQVSR